MKTIRIKSLKLTNFKGIRSLVINELSKETFIYGDNGVGKTTIFDAFTWVLFGKDSTDRQVFELKTLNSKNQVIPKIDHVVDAVIEANGQTIELRKTLREKWVTKRGSLEAEFTGNETVYEWNGVPMNAGEYTAKISQIVDEKVFKLITSPAAFNTLKWADQRDVLIDMVGEVSDTDVASGIDDFEALVNKLQNENKSLDEYKKQVKASITKSKNELKTIPTRIDEVERAKPEPLDFTSLRNQLAAKEKEIDNVNDQIADKMKAQEAFYDKQKGIQQDIFAVETEINNKRRELQTKAADAFNEAISRPREIQREIDAIDRDIQSNDQTIAIRRQKISGQEYQVKQLDDKLAEKRKAWESENAKTFKMDESECACPTCKRAFDAADIAEKRADLEEHFTITKKATLSRLSTEGQNMNAEKLAIEKQIQSLKEDVASREEENTNLWKKRADLSEQLKAFDASKSQDAIYQELLRESEAFFNTKKSVIENFKSSLGDKPEIDVAELKAKRDAIKSEIQQLEAQISTENQIEKHNARIKELSAEENQLAQAVADMEKELFTIEAFEKEKSTRIEESVNNRFSLVNFKLFETQINGADVPTCKALINGVPFSDANTASKINAGLDIINTLCRHYGANAPIFIDNRESVVDLIPTESQVINLIVSEADKKLRVVSMKEELQTA